MPWPGLQLDRHMYPPFECQLTFSLCRRIKWAMPVWTVIPSSSNIGWHGLICPAENGSGLHMRMRTRAYIVAGSNTTSPTDRLLFLNMDVGQADTGVRRGFFFSLSLCPPVCLTTPCSVQVSSKACRSCTTGPTMTQTSPSSALTLMLVLEVRETFDEL